MSILYNVSGSLNRGFVGQISYTICLEKEYDELDIHFTFDKQRFEHVDKEFRTEMRNVCLEKYKKTVNENEEDKLILNEMKTEIHTLAMLNNEFIGCIHKQLSDRHMIFTKEYASEGCISQERYAGSLKIILLVFNVILDDTKYKLSVSGV